MKNIPDQFEFRDLNDIPWKVAKLSGEYWLWRKHPDGGWISQRKVKLHSSFTNGPSELELFYEKSQGIHNYREGYN